MSSTNNQSNYEIILSLLPTLTGKECENIARLASVQTAIVQNEFPDSISFLKDKFEWKSYEDCKNERNSFFYEWKGSAEFHAFKIVWKDNNEELLVATGYNTFLIAAGTTTAETAGFCLGPLVIETSFPEANPWNRLRNTLDGAHDLFELLKPRGITTHDQCSDFIYWALHNSPGHIGMLETTLNNAIFE